MCNERIDHKVLDRMLCSLNAVLSECHLEIRVLEHPNGGNTITSKIIDHCPFLSVVLPINSDSCVPSVGRMFHLGINKNGYKTGDVDDAEEKLKAVSQRIALNGLRYASGTAGFCTGSLIVDREQLVSGFDKLGLEIHSIDTSRGWYSLFKADEASVTSLAQLCFETVEYEQWSMGITSKDSAALAEILDRIIRKEDGSLTALVQSGLIGSDCDFVFSWDGDWPAAYFWFSSSRPEEAILKALHDGVMAIQKSVGLHDASADHEYMNLMSHS